MRYVALLAQPLLVGVLPSLMLSLAVARFTLTHFFVRAPFLLDSGLLSGIAYRSGPLLTPPPIACDYATSFYQVYVSPIVSVFSGLSYLVPVGRIEWFAFVEGLVYFPLGIAVYALARRVAPSCALRRLPITMVAALSFAFSGLVLWMIRYPHYEAATPGLLCLLLVAVVSGRTRLSWMLLAFTVSVRQDGGAHAALALLPVLYLKWRGTEMLPSKRRLVAIIVVALAASVAGFAFQRLFFVPADRMRAIYTGSPAYSHLSFSVVVERARTFVEICHVIYYPFLATVLVAALRRDARYLLGWAATLPWFLFNFVAFDDSKSSFAVYTVAPFLVGVFWVYLYGAVLTPPNRRMRAGALEAVFALVCISSTLGYYRAAPALLKPTVRDMAFSHERNRPAVHGFVDALRMRRADFGRLYVDYAVAALAQEWLQLGDLWQPGVTQVPDAIAFHDRAWGSGLALLPALTAHHLDTCMHVLDTGLHVCSREPLRTETLAAVATETIPASFAFTRVHRPGVDVDARGIVVLGGYSLPGTLGALPRGSYEWVVTVSADSRSDQETAPLARLRVESGSSILAEVTLAKDSHQLVVRFESDGEQRLSYRVTAQSAAPLVITGAQLRQR
ncbi:MAG: hypothetical protein JWP01_2331 [Myxococcales bacterium]|nr:hypothetical protein [Myxococcales bacterium]